MTKKAEFQNREPDSEIIFNTGKENYINPDISKALLTMANVTIITTRIANVKAAPVPGFGKDDIHALTDFAVVAGMPHLKSTLSRTFRHPTNTKILVKCKCFKDLHRDSDPSHQMKVRKWVSSWED